MLQRLLAIKGLHPLKSKYFIKPKCLVDVTEGNEFCKFNPTPTKLEHLVFDNFLTKTSEQHKERLVVVVSFFVYFRRVSSLSETSSGNDYN